MSDKAFELRKILSLKANAMSEEEIIGILPGWMNRGAFMYKDHCRFVFTTNRLIVAADRRPIFAAVQHGPDYLAFNASARDKMKMKEMSVEEALRSDPKNLEIKYDDIKVVEIRPQGKGMPINFFVYTDSIDTPKHKFGVTIMIRYLDDFRKLVETVLPGKT